MSDQSDVQIPLPTEKLSHKFILDSLKGNLFKRTAEELPDESIPTPPQTEMAPVEARTASLPLPEGKKYFRIGEVSDLIGVEPYVLRYWETEFRTIKPTKSSTGHRVYSKKDVELLGQIKHLLHNENFSIKGAKKKLLEMKHETQEQKEQKVSDKQLLKTLHHELKELIAVAKIPL